jgi:hypothetical protein
MHLVTLRVDGWASTVCTVAWVRRITSRTASSTTGLRTAASLKSTRRSRNGSG